MRVRERPSPERRTRRSRCPSCQERYSGDPHPAVQRHARATSLVTPAFSAAPPDHTEPKRRCIGPGQDQAENKNPPFPLRAAAREAVRRGALRVRLPPRGHCATGALIPQSAARPAQRRRTPGILPGSLPPSRVESLASRQRSISELARHRCIPDADLIVNTPATSATPVADTARPFTIAWNQ